MNDHFTHRTLRVAAPWAAALLAGSAAGQSMPCSSLRPNPPPSIVQLRSSLPAVRFDGITEGETAHDLRSATGSFRVGELREHFSMTMPSELRSKPLPVIIAAHGFVPLPESFARLTDGVYQRPAAPYRGVIGMYARRGFAVLMPDYRGHADSDGASFTGCYLSSSYYTQDLLALVTLLPQMPGLDPTRVFLWGHSLGGEVGLRALLVTGAFRGAALWDSVGGTLWEQAFFYSRYLTPMQPDSSLMAKGEIDQLRRELSAAGLDFDLSAREPSLYLEDLRTPLIIHHSIHDSDAAYAWSMRLAANLAAQRRSYEFWTYPGAKHLLEGQARAAAVERDVRFFQSLMPER